MIPNKTTLGRLIVFNKIKGIPTLNQTRPIVTLSPLMKILELLIFDRLKQIAN